MGVTPLDPEEHLLQVLVAWGSCGPTWERTQPICPCMASLTPTRARLGWTWQAASSSQNLLVCLCEGRWPELKDADGTSPRLCNGLWSLCPALTPAVGLYRDTKPLPRSPGLGTSVGHAPRLKAQAQIRSAQRKVFIEMLAWTGGTWGRTGLRGTGTWSPPELLVSRRDFQAPQSLVSIEIRARPCPWGQPLLPAVTTDEGRAGGAAPWDRGGP